MKMEKVEEIKRRKCRISRRVNIKMATITRNKMEEGPQGYVGDI
jgi:hypothetical protein